jgi:hypothetical protein
MPSGKVLHEAPPATAPKKHGTSSAASSWTLPSLSRKFEGEGDGVGCETAPPVRSLDAGALVIRSARSCGLRAHPTRGSSRTTTRRAARGVGRARDLQRAAGQSVRLSRARTWCRSTSLPIGMPAPPSRSRGQAESAMRTRPPRERRHGVCVTECGNPAPEPTLRVEDARTIVHFSCRGTDRGHARSARE